MVRFGVLGLLLLVWLGGCNVHFSTKQDLVAELPDGTKLYNAQMGWWRPLKDGDTVQRLAFELPASQNNEFETVADRVFTYWGDQAAFFNGYESVRIEVKTLQKNGLQLGLLHSDIFWYDLNSDGNWQKRNSGLVRAAPAVIGTIDGPDGPVFAITRKMTGPIQKYQNQEGIYLEMHPIDAEGTLGDVLWQATNYAYPKIQEWADKLDKPTYMARIFWRERKSEWEYMPEMVLNGYNTLGGPWPQYGDRQAMNALINNFLQENRDAAKQTLVEGQKQVPFPVGLINVPMAESPEKALDAAD